MCLTMRMSHRVGVVVGSLSSVAPTTRCSLSSLFGIILFVGKTVLLFRMENEKKTSAQTPRRIITSCGLNSAWFSLAWPGISKGESCPAPGLLTRWHSITSPPSPPWDFVRHSWVCSFSDSSRFLMTFRKWQNSFPPSYILSPGPLYPLLA